MFTDAGQGQALRATRLCGTAEVVLEATGAKLGHPDQAEYEQTIAMARGTLSEALFAAAWAEGRAMSVEQAITYALEDGIPLPEDTAATSELTAPVAPPPALEARPAGLTAREVEVLRLVAQGLSDREVAERLVVSPRTVNAHLTSIYSKLGVSSRAAATRFAVEHHLV